MAESTTTAPAAESPQAQMRAALGITTPEQQRCKAEGWGPGTILVNEHGDRALLKGFDAWGQLSVDWFGADGHEVANTVLSLGCSTWRKDDN